MTETSSTTEQSTSTLSTINLTKNECSREFLLVCLYAKLAPTDRELLNQFILDFQKIFSKFSFLSLNKLYCFIFFRSFVKQFQQILMEKKEKFRVDFLLCNANPKSFIGLTMQNQSCYFVKLEESLFEKSFVDLKDRESIALKYFKQARFFFVKKFLKKNYKILLFLLLIVLCFYVSLKISVSANSISVSEQIFGWLHFLLKLFS